MVKRTIYLALVLCLVVALMAGCGKKKEKTGPTGPVIPQVGTVLWNFETDEEVAKFDNDNTGAELELDTKTVAEGKAALKVTPNGEAEETKIAAVLDQAKVGAWNASKNLVLKLYMDQGMNPAINIVFLGIADVTGGNWSWVDGTFLNIAGAKTGQWNTCVFDLTAKPTMLDLDPKRDYKFYFSFYNEDGEKTPLASSSSFYVDYIYIDGQGSSEDPGEDPGEDPEPALLWGFESENEATEFAEDGGTGAVPTYTTEQAFAGTGALKVTPSGTAEETKIKVRLPVTKNENWKNSSNLVLNLYMAEGMAPAVNKIFVGMADVTNDGWEWVEGTTSSLTEVKLGEWNECKLLLPHKMINIDPTKQYELYFSFFNEVDGAKTPLADAFYIDEISVE